MRTKSILSIASVSLVLLLSACTRDNMTVPQSDQTLNGVDVEFIRKASADNYFEIQMGLYAATNATDPDVKAYGSRMVTEHTIAQQELEKLAAQFKISLPATVDYKDLDKMNKQKNTANGAAFDNIYITYEVLDHKAAMALYQKEVKTGNHKTVVAYAARYLANVESHLIDIQGVTP